MVLNNFFEELDLLFKTKDIKAAEKYVVSAMEQAQQEKDLPAIVAIANELGGIYRVANKFDEAKKVYSAAIETIKILGLENTEQHGTTLLNLASVFSEAKEPVEALKIYKQAAQLFETAGSNRDYTMAALYNNMSHVYDMLGQVDESISFAERALAIIKGLAGHDTELATSYTTLASRYLKKQKFSEAMGYLKLAEKIFLSMPGRINVHYAATLNSMGELHYRQGNKSDAVSAFERALDIIKSNYGENNAYAEVLKNLSKAKELIAEGVNRKTGLETAESYYNEYGRKMIKDSFADYEKYMAVGLVGEGSECFGYDDVWSESHDYGPGFCIWLPDDIFQKIGGKLQAAYNDMPKTFENRTRVESVEGGGRVGVLSTQEFYRKYIGCSGAPKNNVEWIFAPETSLATVTNGKVFVDHLGEFTEIRKALLKFYPKDVYLKKLAARMAMMSQTGQYNYERCMKRADYSAAYISCSEFVKTTVSIIYLLNQKYMPFYKWMFRGLEDLETLKELKEQLAMLAATPDIPENTAKKVSLIEEICSKIRDALHSRQIIAGSDAFLNSHARHVVCLIADEQIRNLPIMFDGR
jgi:tetratricopeptide (TPR) repeat protein